MKKESEESKELKFYEHAETVISLADSEVKRKVFAILCQFMMLSSTPAPETLTQKMDNYFVSAVEVGMNEKNEELLEELFNCIIPPLLENKLPISKLGPKILVNYLDVNNFSRDLMKQLLKCNEVISLIFETLIQVFFIIFRISFFWNTVFIFF